MSRAGLEALAPPGIRCTIGYTGIALGPLSSNLFMFMDQGGAA
jgi:hypothetical protein